MSRRVRTRLLVPLVAAAQFLVMLDLTIVNMALPALQADLALSPTSLHWVVTAYAVAFGGSLLIAGRLGDVAGRRRVFAAGLAVFTLASLACGLAPSGDVLVVARVAQGIGAAMVSPAAFAILLAAFPAGAERNRAIATWGSIGSLGAVAGLVLGGALTDLSGWRSVFLVNVPIGFVALAGIVAVVPPSRATRSGRVDVLAGASVTAGLGALVFVLSNGPVAGWGSRGTVAAAFASLVLFAAFVWRERDALEPLLPTSVLGDRAFLVAGAVGMLHGAVVLGMLLLLAVYLQGGRGLSSLQAAVALLLLRAPAIGWAGVVGRLMTRFGPQPLLLAGAILMTAGVGLLTALPAHGSMAPTLVPGLLIVGLAIPCSFVSASGVALDNAPLEHAGVASGLLKAFQWVGGALGLAVVAAATGGLDSGAHDTGSLLEAVQVGFVACTALATLGVAVACLGLPRARRPRVATAG